MTLDGRSDPERQFPKDVLVLCKLPNLLDVLTTNLLRDVKGKLFDAKTDQNGLEDPGVNRLLVGDCLIDSSNLDSVSWFDSVDERPVQNDLDGPRQLARRCSLRQLLDDQTLVVLILHEPVVRSKRVLCRIHGREHS